MGSFPRLELPATERGRMCRVVEGECGFWAPSRCHQWGECDSPAAGPALSKHTQARGQPGSQASLRGSWAPPWGRRSVLVPPVVLEPPGSSLLGRSRQACWSWRGVWAGVRDLPQAGRPPGVGHPAWCRVSEAPACGQTCPALPAATPAAWHYNLKKLHSQVE